MTWWTSNQLTLCPGGKPGSQTARESSLTRRSWTWPMLSPTLSKPSCSMPRVGTSEFKSSPKTFPKPRRNCISIRQSDTARPGRMSPGIRENSGRGCREKRVKLRLLWIWNTKKYDFNSYGKTGGKLWLHPTSVNWYQDGAFQFRATAAYFLHYAVLSFYHLGAHTSTHTNAHFHVVLS